MSDDPHHTAGGDTEEEADDRPSIDPAPVDIDLEDIEKVLPHRDDPDQDPPGSAGAPVPPG